MINLLVKSLTVIGSCGGLALLSTLWSKTDSISSLNKVNFNNKGQKLDAITRLEEIDVWGQENGCNFIFVKDFSKNEIYTAIDYAKANGGREKPLGSWLWRTENKNLEQAIVNAVNKHKDYCIGETKKLKTFTFLWSPANDDFYIGNPDEHTEREKAAIRAFLAKKLFFWKDDTVRRESPTKKKE